MSNLPNSSISLWTANVDFLREVGGSHDLYNFKYSNNIIYSIKFYFKLLLK